MRDYAIIWNIKFMDGWELQRKATLTITTMREWPTELERI